MYIKTYTIGFWLVISELSYTKCFWVAAIAPPNNIFWTLCYRVMFSGGGVAA